jgi:hypothetical protein
MNIKFEHTMMSAIPTTEFGRWSVASADCKPSSLPNDKQRSLLPLILNGQCTETYLDGEDLYV